MPFRLLRRRRFLVSAVAAIFLVLSAGLSPGAGQDRPAAEPAPDGRYGAALAAYESALRGLEEAADGGDAHAQWVLSAMYLSGTGAPKDHAKAVQWLQRAADAGHLEAQYQLGSAYDLGLGVERDPVQALTWLEIAAARGHEAASAARGSISEGLAPDRRLEVQRAARAWLEENPVRSP